MGAKYRDIVQEHSNAKRSARAVLNVLANYANSDGIAFPGYETIANDAGISVRTVERNIKVLISMGELEQVGHHGGHGSQYQKLRITLNSNRPSSPDKVTGVSQDILATPPDSLSNSTRQTDNLHPTSSASSLYIEPDLEPKDEPDPTADAERSLTPWQEFMGALCWVCYGHDQVKALTKEQTGQLTSEAKKIKDLGFDIDDLRTWYKEVWRVGWQVDKNSSSRPVPSQVRTSLPSIRADVPEGFDAPKPISSKGGRISKIDNNMLAIDQAVAYLEKHGINPL